MVRRCVKGTTMADAQIEPVPVKLTFVNSGTYFLACDSMLSQISLSVCLSVTRVDQSKTVEVRIMQFSLHSSPISVLFAI